MLKHGGITKSVTEWERFIGCSAGLILHRINRYGWDIDKAITTPPTISERVIEYDSKRLLISEWAKELNLDIGTIKYRLRAGWSIADTFETQVTKGVKYEHNGHNLTLKEWADRTGIGLTTLQYRISTGVPIEFALGKPDKGKKHSR